MIIAGIASAVLFAIFRVRNIEFEENNEQNDNLLQSD